MKSKFFIGGLLLTVMVLLFSCNQSQEPAGEISAVEKEKIKAEIQKLEDNLALIYNQRNADSLTYYADDAVSYINGQSPRVGKAAIHKLINEELQNLPEGVKLQFKTIEVQVAKDGQFVFEVGEYKRVDSSGTVLQTGNYFSFFVKRDGKYLCVRDMANSGPVEDLPQE